MLISWDETEDKLSTALFIIALVGCSFLERGRVWLDCWIDGILLN